MEAKELYLIPLLGNIKYYITKNGDVFTKRKKLHLLKSEIRAGYPSVTLSIIPKRPKKFLIHRLMCFTFLENKYIKPCVNHIDGDKLNNKIHNLQWVTYSENERHSFDVLGKKIRHSEETKDKIRQAAFRHKSYLDNFKYTSR